MKTCVWYMFNSDISSYSKFYRLASINQVVYHFSDTKEKDDQRL